MFNELRWLSLAEGLDNKARSIFIGWCILRLSQGYSEYWRTIGASTDNPVTMIWEFLLRKRDSYFASDTMYLESIITDNFPQEDFIVDNPACCADVASECGLYALRFIRDGEPAQLYKIAYAMYAAADNAAINALYDDVVVVGEEIEQRIMEHYIVQLELSRQLRDFSLARTIVDSQVEIYNIPEERTSERIIESVPG